MFEGLEKRVSKAGNISYWKDGEIVYKQCSKCKEIKKIEEFDKNKYQKTGVKSECKECFRKRHTPKYGEEYLSQYKDIEGLEKKVSKVGNISYWNGDVIVYKQCTGCKEIKSVVEFDKQKKSDGYRERCKTCRKLEGKEYNERNAEKVKERHRIYYQSHKEEAKEYKKKYKEENREKILQKSKEYREMNKEKIKQYRDSRKDILKEYNKEYRKNNIERLREYEKEYHIKNRERKAEYDRQYRSDNSDKISEYQKKYREEHKEELKESRRKYCSEKRKIDKEENLKYITSILEQINPKFKQLNLPIYGIIYKITNKLNDRCYIGQTIQPLKERYRKGIIKGWIEERVNCDNQKFKEDLIEENFTFDIIDVATSRWHLDKLEAHYINKYNSYENGYNNNTGFWSRDDGLEEFKNILKENNLEFVDGELRRIV